MQIVLTMFKWYILEFILNLKNVNFRVVTSFNLKHKFMDKYVIQPKKNNKSFE